MYNMVTIENPAKKWGHSFAVIIPSEIAQRINLKAGQIIKMDIKLKKRIDAFGKFSGAKPFKEEESTHEKFW